MPLRTTKPDDIVDQIFESYEEAVGEKPDGCPWQALSQPFVLEVIRARNWREHGELDQRYPHGVPNVIVEAIDVYDAAFNTTQCLDMREDREEREREAAKKALENS